MNSPSEWVGEASVTARDYEILTGPRHPRMSQILGEVLIPNPYSTRPSIRRVRRTIARWTGCAARRGILGVYEPIVTLPNGTAARGSYLTLKDILNQPGAIAAHESCDRGVDRDDRR
jgi:hypothetical protein